MTKKSISLMNFESNPNIGIYMFVNDKFALIGQEVEETKQKEIEKVLGVPMYKVTILGTELLGLFAAGNNDILVVPEMFDYEKKKIEEICKKHKTQLITVNERKNTFGSNICIGDKTILINDEYKEEFETQLKKQTKYKIIRIKNKTFNAVGATIKFLNNKYFLSQEYDEKDVKSIIKNIGGIGTVNKGSNYISSGVVGNSKGLIIGAMSTTIEIQSIVEGLDYRVYK